MARPDFRAAAARRLSEDRELPPAIVSLLSPETTHPSTGVKLVPIDRIEPNPEQPRLAFDEATLEELAASIREHGVLQPILLRPIDNGRFQLIAGERRWRASKIAGHPTIPALVEDIDDDTALEISIIENLQREDISPLDEAAMYDRMIRDHGYSIRRLADKLGKDKGYLENRLRLADAPPEVRQLVSLRKDTLSHAYELMKVEDPKKRRRLADQVARGELTLVKLRERIEGRPARVAREAEEPGALAEARPAEEADGWDHRERVGIPIADDSLVAAKQQLNEAVEDLLGVIRSQDVLDAIGPTDRANLAKYLTIAKRGADVPTLAGPCRLGIVGGFVALPRVGDGVVASIRSGRGASRSTLDLVAQLDEGQLAPGNLCGEPLALPGVLDLHQLVGMGQRVFAQGHELADLRRRVRESQSVLEVALVLAQLLRQATDRVAMVANHAVVHRRFVERGEVLALEVLDDRDLQGRVVVDLLDEGGDRREARGFRRAPAALAGDELELAVVERPDEDRLEDAVLADRRRQLVEAGLLHRETRLFRVRRDSIHADVANAAAAPALAVIREQADDCR